MGDSQATICASARYAHGSGGRSGEGQFQVHAYWSRAFQNRFAGVLAGVFWLAAVATPAGAQAVSEVAKNLDPAFATALTNPGSLPAALTYAVSSTQAGDIEFAISTFDRLLFYNPKLSRVRFELGVLYFRLGSYEQARGYFKSALQMADVTPELAQRAEDFLTAIDKKLRVDQFSGFAQTGVRYQTNASLGPGPQSVLASGRTFDNRFAAHPDWNWFGAFGLNYVHDFGTQYGDTFETSIIGYDAQQFTLHQFDLGLLELRAGPRFGIFPEYLNGASIKPYAIATGSLLADTPFSGAAGGGLTVHVNAGNLALDPYVEVVQQSYRNSSFYPLASGLSGTLQTYALQTSGPVVSGLGWQTRLAFAHDDAVFTPYSYNSFSADLWLPWNFSVPWYPLTWTLTPNIGVTNWRYQAPDPAIDPTVAQRSLGWRAGLEIDIPIRNLFSFGALLQYSAIASNIPVFNMKNLAITLGPTVKF